MNSITNRQTTWNGGSFPSQYDTVKVFEGDREYYKHGNETFATKSALRRALSSEYGGAWIEEKDGKKRYFIDESGWLQRSIREVSKEEFAQKFETPSTWQKVLGIGLGVLALAPGAVEFARHIPKEAGVGLLALQQKSPLLGTVGYSCLPSSADAQAMGTEFQVNTYTISDQTDPSIAPLNNGGFVVTWESNGQDGDLRGIYGQRYNASGARAGTEFQVNTYTTSHQWFPSVAPLNDGGFVVTWTSEGQDGDRSGIYGQRYNATGARAGIEFQVNTYTTNTQNNPSVATLNDGGFVVTWTSSVGQDGSADGIYGQRYNATGVPNGAEFQVNTETTGDQTSPSVAPLNDGGFVVTWMSDGQDGNGDGIFGQRYNATGARAGTEFQINTYWVSNQYLPNVAPLNNGGFVVTWTSNGQDGDSVGIFGQRYDSSGVRAGTEFQVNTYTTSFQWFPRVAPLNDGGFVVTWESGQDGDLSGIYGQIYNANGARSGTEFQVNTYTTNEQQRPSVAPLNDGGFVVTWESDGQDGSGEGIFGQRYDSNGTPVGPPLQASRSSAASSQLTSSAFLSSLTPSPSQIFSSSSLSLDTSEVSLISSSPSTSELGTQSSPTSTQGLLTSAPSSTSDTSVLSSNLNQSQAYTSRQNSMRTPPSSVVPSTTSRMPIPSGSIIYSVIDIVYEESYPIYINGQTVGTFTISGGSGLLNSGNLNVITMHFNPTFAPEEEDEFIPLFSIPPGQGTDWQSIHLEDTDFECLEAIAEINPNTSGDSEFGLIFTGADSCASGESQIVAGILPIMIN